MIQTKYKGILEGACLVWINVRQDSLQPYVQLRIDHEDVFYPFRSKGELEISKLIGEKLVHHSGHEINNSLIRTYSLEVLSGDHMGRKFEAKYRPIDEEDEDTSRPAHL